MDQISDDTGRQVDEAQAERADELDLDSVTLARLIAEVRNEDVVEANAYNRVHNRHNR